MEKNNNHNGHGNGFVPGVIVGVIVTLLFTTKRGREIVKDMAEKGLDKFAELQKAMNEASSDMVEAVDEMEEALEEEMVEGEDYVGGSNGSEETASNELEEKVKEKPKLKARVEVKSAPKEEKQPVNGTRRFFSKKPKKS